MSLIHLLNAFVLTLKIREENAEKYKRRTLDDPRQGNLFPELFLTHPPSFLSVFNKVYQILSLDYNPRTMQEIHYRLNHI